MKLYLAVVLSLFVFQTNAQTTYNNKINKLQSLKIYGQNAKVIIGTVMVNQTLETKLYLISSTQLKNDSNYYITTFHLGNNQMVALFGAKVQLFFSKPVIDVSFRGLNGVMMGLGYGLAEDKKSYIFKAQQINRDPDSKEILTLTVKSKERILIDLLGVDGILE